MKVLLVEDEAALANVIARNLSARSHDVVVAGSAEEALLSMAERGPEVLILDVNLPDLTGWEILRRLSPDDRRNIRVIVISAAPLSQKRIDEFQPLRWLQKPFPIDALVRLLREADTPAGAETDSR
jgi:two-component system KDP operon response regulator KdpE